LTGRCRANDVASIVARAIPHGWETGEPIKEGSYRELDRAEMMRSPRAAQADGALRYPLRIVQRRLPALVAPGSHGAKWRSQCTAINSNWKHRSAL